MLQVTGCFKRRASSWFSYWCLQTIWHLHSFRWRMESYPEVPCSHKKTFMHTYMLSCTQYTDVLFVISFSLSPGNSRPTSPKSDSELITKASDTDNQNPAMHWAWGELPQAAKVSKVSSEHTFTLQ